MAADRIVAVFGGVYNNALALEAVIADARRRGADELVCLGDMGGFGPHPDRVFAPLIDNDVRCIQGNYDDSIGNELDDCQCGYTDPRDNHYAQISYDYTLANTSADGRAWLRDLPPSGRDELAGRKVLYAHGSPRRVNEFLWDSTSGDAFLDHLLAAHETDVLFVTHTGLHWSRELPSGRVVINVGAIGRPANDGRTEVWYTLVRASDTGAPLSWQQIPVAYDHERLARQMRAEGLPELFAETILSGWWTTCLEVLPAKERHRSRY